MEISGEQLIHASQWDVWTELNNPQTLKDCLPGCEAIDKLSDCEFRVEMLTVVGPVKARFKGALTLSDVDAPNRYLLAFEGAGGAGFARGTATVSLTPDTGCTRLAYHASAHVGGKLAQIGSRLVDGVAKKTTAEFFSRFNARFEAVVAAADDPHSGAAETADTGESATLSTEASPHARPGNANQSGDETRLLPGPAQAPPDVGARPSKAGAARAPQRRHHKRLKRPMSWATAVAVLLIVAVWIVYVLQ